MKRVFIEHIESYLPDERISNDHVEERIRAGGFPIQTGLLEKMIGSETRYYAEKNEQASDLAAAAAKKIIEKIPNRKIDLLIFAAASGDLIEPATVNIVQQKLRLKCPGFDLKNACNSVTNAIEIASALLLQGSYENILIVSGEKTSDSIKYTNLEKETIKDHFAAYSFGDAGVALLLTTTTDDKGFIFQRHQTFGEHWNLCRIEGGGSMYPSDASKLVFSGDTFGLKNVIYEIAPPFVKDCIKEAGLTVNDIDLICTHQVSKDTYRMVAETLSYDVNKIMQTFHLFGNTAATSVPIAYQQALLEGRLQKGNIVMLLGMAAGINISVQLMKV
ncbi:3-oxoacyl-ACP synthase III family protein [Lacibacter sp. H407]|uniref:3-oxoacyl-ACP synthase III family protein n=1 Tax=Lacibacter sp. H407 TaxID=3133423 RepID=UPI0030BD7066